MAGLLRLFLLLGSFFLLRRLWRQWRIKTSRSQTPSAPPAEKLSQCPHCKEYVVEKVAHCRYEGCPRILPLIFSIFFLPLLMFTQSASADEGGGRYLFNLSGENVAIDMIINDIPMRRLRISERSEAAGAFNHWLKSGTNTVRLKLSALNKAKPMIVHARLFFSGLNAQGGLSDIDLMNIDKQPASGEVTAISFNVPSSPPLNLWKVTPKPMDAEARKALRGLLINMQQELVDVVESGSDVRDMPSLLLEKADLTQAFSGQNLPQTALPVPPDVNQDEIAMLPLPSESDLVVTQLGINAGLYLVTRKNADALLAARIKQRDWIISSLIVGYLGGKWQVLRHNILQGG